MVQEKRRLIPAELKRVGWEALVQKLGLADATRFLFEYDGLLTASEKSGHSVCPGRE